MILSNLPTLTFFYILLAYFIGGITQGILGVGLITVVISLLSFVVDVKETIALVIIPTIITSFFGFYMLFKNTALLGLSWMKVKLIFVSILIIYTILSQTILNQLNKGTIKLNDLQLRLWNEGATLLLISIISLAVLKTSISWLKAIFVFLLIGITLMFLINLYKRLLNK